MAGSKAASVKKERGSEREAVSSKAPKDTAGRRKDGKPRRKPKLNFGIYLKRVSRQVNAKMGLTPRAMSILTSLVYDVRDRLCSESKRLVAIRTTRKGGFTMGSRDIQSAVKLVIPGELAKHAMSEGTKACRLFAQSKAMDARVKAVKAEEERASQLTSLEH